MKRPENNKWLDEALTETIGSEKPRTDFEKWKKQHPEAVKMLTSRAGSGALTLLGPPKIRRTIMKNPITKLAAAAVIIVGVVLSVSRQPHIAPADKYLLSHAQLNQLNTAFSHVRQIFGQHSPWMVFDSGGKGEIGVDNQMAEAANANKVIIIRLAVNIEGREAKQRYFDVVTFSNQQVCFHMPAADDYDDDYDMDVSLKPTIASNGGITVEINARLDNGSQVGDTAAVVNDSFTSLVRLQANGSWININAVGRPASNI